MSNSTFTLTETEQKQLLKLARDSIISYVTEQKKLSLNAQDFSENPSKECGAFVTLHKQGNLRGCIGRFMPEQPLYEVIRDMVIASATQDYRFSKVTPSEIDDIDIEISVLTPLKKITDANEIELGKHGIYIIKGHSSGTFLPQVATETGWSLDEFLGHCSRDKCGIGWDGWKKADLFTYEAIIFSEEKSN